MKNKVIIISFIIIMIFTLTGCGKVDKENKDAIKFKEDYESLNGLTNDKDKEYRNILIEEDNPFKYIDEEELIKKIDNKESFYVYFGSKFCPWCRSVIEKAIQVANDNGVSTIYYIDIWDDERNEILRDKYEIDENNELKQTIKGTDGYYELLNRFDEFLPNYELKDQNGNNIDVGEKRIYAPSFIYVKEGEARSLVDGISSKQNGAYDELSDEVLTEEEEIFNEFFALVNTCDEKC